MAPAIVAIGQNYHKLLRWLTSSHKFSERKMLHCVAPMHKQIEMFPVKAGHVQGTYCVRYTIGFSSGWNATPTIVGGKMIVFFLSDDFIRQWLCKYFHHQNAQPHHFAQWPQMFLKILWFEQT